MPILLEIPAQKATGGEARIAAMVDCDKQGFIRFEAFDKKTPRIFILPPGGDFPWKQFFQKLRLAWFRSANQEIPPAFRLKKKIDETLLDEIEKQPANNLPKIFAELRKAGFFKPLPNALSMKDSF